MNNPINNPIAGQHFNVTLHTDEPLAGATVTIEYKNNNGREITGVSHSGVNESTGNILWIMTPEITQMGGTFKIKAKIVTSANKVYYNANEVSVTFDKKF